MNVLLCSVGYRSYLVDYFRAALNGSGLVYAGDYTPLSPALYRADRILRLRKRIDNAYALDILKQCLAHDIGLVVPLSDYELPVLSRHVETFRQQGVLLMLSDRAVIDLCRDKRATYEHLVAHGLPVPRTFSTPDEALTAIQAGELSWPLLVKPRQGSAGRGIHRVEDEEELSVYWRLDCVVQERINGQEYGLDVLTDTMGRPLTVVPRLKLAMRAGETDKAFSVQDPVLIQLGIQIAESLAPLGLRGPFDVDLFVDEESTPRVLEINPRFGGGYPVAHLSGARFPEKLIALARGETVEPDFGAFQAGTIMLKQLAILALSPDQLPSAWGTDYLKSRD